MKVNGQSVVLVENTYSFTLELDTVVEVLFSELWETLSLNDMILIVNQLNKSLFIEGNLEVLVDYQNDYTESNISGIVELNNNLDITNGHISISAYDKEFNDNTQTIYYTDGQFVYIKFLDYENDILIDEGQEIIPISLNSQFLESLGGIFLMMNFGPEVGSFLPSGPFTFNNLFDSVLGYGLNQILLNSDFFNLFSFKKQGDIIKISLNLENDQILGMISEIIEDVFNAEVGELADDEYLEISLELIFNNYQFESLSIAYNAYLNEQLQTVSAKVSYQSQKPEEFLYLADFDTSNLVMYLYHIHFDEQTVVDILVHEDLVDLFDILRDEELINLFSFYKEGYIVSGLYLDSDFSIPILASNFLNTDLDIYVKWEPKLTFSELLDKFFYEDYFLFEDNSLLYIETAEHIMLLQYHYDEYLFFDKDEQKLYFLVFDDNSTEYFAYEISDEDLYLVSVMDALNQMKEDEFIIDISSGYLSIQSGILLLDEMILFTGLVDYGIDNNVYFPITDSDLLGELDEFYDLIIAVVENPFVDSVTHIDIYSEPYIYADINKLETQLVFIVSYESGFNVLMTLIELKQAELVDYILPSADNGYQFTVFLDGETFTIDHYVFYDSLLGQIVVFDGMEGYEYLDQLTELPTFADDFVDIAGWQTDFGTVVLSLEELKDLSIEEEIIYLSPRFALKEFADVIPLIEESGSLVITEYGFEIYYDLDKNEFFITHDWGYYDDFILKYTDEFLIVYDEDVYVEVPLENFSPESFYYSIFEQNFHYGLNNDIFEFLRFLNEIFTGKKTLEIFESYYVYEDSVEVYLVPEEGWLIFSANHFHYQTVFGGPSFDNIEGVYNHEYIIENNVVENSLTIKSKHQSNGLQVYSAYAYDGYVFDYYYYFDSQGEVDFEEVFDPYLVKLETYIRFFANYVVYQEPADYFHNVNANQMYILKNEKFEIRVDKDIQITIYDEDELLYVLDLVNEDAYIYLDEILYKLQSYDSVFNLQSFFEQLENDHFYFDDINTFIYQTHITNVKALYDFTFNLGKEEVYIQSPSLQHYYNFPYYIYIEEFEVVDLSEYQIEDEEITEISFPNAYEPLSIEGLEYQWIRIEYNTGRYYEYSVNDFLEEFDGVVSDLAGEFYIDVVIGQIDYHLKLSDYGLYIFDLDYDIVILYLEKGYYYDSYYPMFSYLNHITELPILDFGNYNFQSHVGWYFDQFTTDLISLEELRGLDLELGDYIEVYSKFGYNVENALDYLEEMEVVEMIFEINHDSYWRSAKYIYSLDTFVLYQNDYSNQIVGYATFSGDKIIVYEEDGFYFEVDYNVFEITVSPGYQPFGYDNFDFIIQMLIDARKFLRSDFDYSLVEQVFADLFEIGEWLSVGFSNDWLWFSPLEEGENDYQVEIVFPNWVSDYFVAQPGDYNYEFVIVNGHNEQQIILKSALIIGLDMFVFDLPEKVFTGYYYLDQNQEPDFNAPVELGELGPGSYVIFSNLE